LGFCWWDAVQVERKNPRPVADAFPVRCDAVGKVVFRYAILRERVGTSMRIVLWAAIQGSVIRSAFRIVWVRNAAMMGVGGSAGAMTGYTATARRPVAQENVCLVLRRKSMMELYVQLTSVTKQPGVITTCIPPIMQVVTTTIHAHLTPVTQN